MTIERLMPARIDLGTHSSTTLAFPIGHKQSFDRGCEFLENKLNLRVVMGFFLPVWQRDLVWTEAQKISFVESAWKGLNLGTFTYNEGAIGSPYDNLLIDGQQRLSAIEDYINDKFKVFGYLYSEITIADKRSFNMTTVFASYKTISEDEQWLKDYYNLTNFGGTAHKESERA